MENDIFIRIYNQYFPYVYRYLYGLTYHQQTAEDLAQETFLKALSIIQHPSDSIKSWLLVVAHNLYVDYVKKNRRLVFHQDEQLNQLKIQDFTDQLVIEETTKSAFTLLHQLPENQRQVVLLCLVNELSYKEAGEILGISVSSVTNLIYRARKTLRALRRDKNE